MPPESARPDPDALLAKVVRRSTGSGASPPANVEFFADDLPKGVTWKRADNLLLLRV